MWIPPPPLLTHLHRESRGTSLERLFFQRLTGCYLHEGLCYNAGHGSTEGGNSHSHALLFRASSFSSLWGSTTGPWRRAWSQDRCEKVPSLTWLRHYGYRRKRWENYAFSKAQQFHGNKKKQNNSESRYYYYYSTGLLCVSQEITSDCTKHFRSTKVIQKSCLVPKFPILKAIPEETTYSKWSWNRSTVGLRDLAASQDRNQN